MITTARGLGHTAPRAGIVPVSRLWFGIFGAPAAWAVQTIVDYSLISHFCYPDDAPLSKPTFHAVRGTSVLVSAVMLFIVLLALVTAYRSWNATRHGHENEHHELLEVGEGRARFMALAGLLVSVVFLFAVVMNALPLLTRTICGV
jgi:predicted signal transduction protein with EAL and GGDEF domain